MTSSLALLLALSAAPCGDPDVPERVSQLDATLVNDAVTLIWEDNSDNETGFMVWRASRGGWKIIAWLPSNQTSYVDNQLESDHVYIYFVTSYHPGDKCNYSWQLSNVAVVRAP